VSTDSWHQHVDHGGIDRTAAIDDGIEQGLVIRDN
jgi:hypothetical protein